MPEARDYQDRRIERVVFQVTPNERELLQKAAPDGNVSKLFRNLLEKAKIFKSDK